MPYVFNILVIPILCLSEMRGIKNMYVAPFRCAKVAHYAFLVK
jgi:hypothetical protein